MKPGKGRQSHGRRELRKQQPGEEKSWRVRSTGTDARLRLIIDDSSPLGWRSEATRTLSSVRSRPTVTPATLSRSDQRGRRVGEGGREATSSPTVVLIGHIWTLDRTQVLLHHKQKTDVLFVC